MSEASVYINNFTHRSVPYFWIPVMTIKNTQPYTEFYTNPIFLIHNFSPINFYFTVNPFPVLCLLFSLLSAIKRSRYSSCYGAVWLHSAFRGTYFIPEGSFIIPLMLTFIFLFAHTFLWRQTGQKMMWFFIPTGFYRLNIPPLDLFWAAISQRKVDGSLTPGFEWPTSYPDGDLQ